MENPTDLNVEERKNKRKFSKDLKDTYFETETYVTVILERRTFILICDDANARNSDSQPVSKKSRNEQESNDIEGSSCDLNPNAKLVKKISGKVAMTLLYQPWADMGVQYVSECCEKGPEECENKHGKCSSKRKVEKKDDERSLKRYMKNTEPVHATMFMCKKISHGECPPVHIIQYVLLNAFKTSGATFKYKFVSLTNMTEKFSPCDNSMMYFYEKILFGCVKCLNAPDGLFWWCIYRIEELTNKLSDSGFDNMLLTGPWLEKMSYIDFDSDDKSSRENVIKENIANLKHSFSTLDFFDMIMEADLTIGLLKSLTNLNHYVCGDKKPFIVMAIWEDKSDVGTMNAKIRLIMQLYLKAFVLLKGTEYPNQLRRLLSLIGGVTYASQKNLNPPVFPNIRDNCREFATEFAFIMLQASLTLTDVFEMTRALRPVWFQFLVCSHVLEKLDGRREYKTLNSLVILLKELNAARQDFPSSEERSTIVLRDSFDSCIENGKIPRKLFCNLAIMTPLAIVLKISLSGVARVNRNLDANIQFATGVTFVEFNHPSMKEDQFGLKELAKLVRTERNRKGLVETLAFMFE